MRVALRAGRLTVAGFAFLVLGLASSASAAPHAATQSVSVAGFTFNPASLTINVGDSVKWTNSDAATHTVTADAGGFSSTLGPSGGTFTFQFTSAGTFAYHCAIHPSMTGSVVVRAASTPPPTPVPTPIPTPVPTVVPTLRPTVAPTSQPTSAPTPEPTIAPSPTLTATPTTTSAPATTSPVAVASPTNPPATEASRTTTAAAQDGPTIALIIGGFVIVAGLVALVARRR